MKMISSKCAQVGSRNARCTRTQKAWTAFVEQALMVNAREQSNNYFEHRVCSHCKFVAIQKIMLAATELMNAISNEAIQ
jgi:hypothetical protein